MKVCNKCKVEKEFSEFSKSKAKKDGHNIYCKMCEKQYRIYTKENKREYSKKYYLENKDKIKQRLDKYRIDNKEMLKEKNIKYKLENKDLIKLKAKQYRLDSKEYRKQYYLENKDKLNVNRNKYQKNRRLTDPLYKLKCNTSNLIRMSIKKQGYSKTSKTYNILGCSFEEFKIHLETQFTEGMTWNNSGEWELDHIYPVSRAIDEQHLIELNHYTNFQPLWREDNNRKGNTIKAIK